MKPWHKFQIDLINEGIIKAGSQALLARCLGVHRQVISRWKCCHVRMSLDSYIALEKFVGRK